jgi:hypothetical protein
VHGDGEQALVAVALLIAAAGFGSIGTSRAQNQPQDFRAQKKASKGPVQPLRKGAIGAPQVFPGRAAIPRAPLGPGALPLNARIPPQLTGPGLRAAPGGPAQGLRPNALGANTAPGSRFGTNQPGARAIGNQPGSRAFGNQPGNRAFGNRPGSFQSGNRNQPRGFTHRDPRMRAVNAATPQLRQVQRFSHRGEMLAIRARMPRYPLPGERNFTGMPPVSETRFVTPRWCASGDRHRAAARSRRSRASTISTSWRRSARPDRRHAGALPHRRQSRGARRGARDGGRAHRLAAELHLRGRCRSPPPRRSAPGTATSNTSRTSCARRGAQDRDRQGRDGRGDRLEIDDAHPELAKGIAEQFDAVGKPDRPHTHGTGMAGAIVSQDRLMGIRARRARARDPRLLDRHAAIAAGDDPGTSSPGSNGRSTRAPGSSI